jgi:hypothetical protein
MKHIKLFESFVNEGYSKSDLKKLNKFAEEVADEISWEYEDQFLSGDLDEDEYDHNAMYDYIVDWGETNDLTVKEVMAEFDWESLTFELGLR